METSVILRSILCNAKKAENLQALINQITVMCTPEDVALVEKQIADEADEK